YIQGLEFPWTF
nr:immunoglobulin light chain junction region [Macaca mulatta]